MSTAREAPRKPAETIKSAASGPLGADELRQLDAAPPPVIERVAQDQHAASIDVVCVSGLLHEVDDPPDPWDGMSLAG